ncbi:IPTL-CTERM sorting domain-containing protein [Acidovorax radicis]|uniref:IPTL-CTERM sorting domain-containing protein n=1 Tax=Acidovorax radicis TaxID=758826 RepID=UPI001112B2E5|nr:IPTL-CTERM sorting domain-containing protein [Acidovorax radicis]
MIQTKKAATRSGTMLRQCARQGSNAAGRASRAIRWVAFAGVAFLLQACGQTTQSSWIEAPLVADAYSNDADYFPYEPKLLVNSDANAQLKFSYATLPNGVLSKLLVDEANTRVTVDEESYTLDAGKVASARLVLYVDKVITPGYLRIVSAHQTGTDCFGREDLAPACGHLVDSTNGGAATNADNPAQPLRITDPGFYSFDVTKLVKHRLANGVESMVVVAPFLDPGTATGSFEFASKEQQTGQAHVLHQPQLLITLSDVAGVNTNAPAATSVRQSSTDPAVATQNFSRDENLWMNGASGNRAYALIGLPPPPTGPFSLRFALNQMGSVAGKQTMVVFVNERVADQATAQPEAQFYRRRKFNVVGQVVNSWNDGWAEPPGSALIANVPLDRGAQNQTLFIDMGSHYVTTLADAYTANRTQDLAVAASTNLQMPVTLDSDDNTKTGRVPRFVTVFKPDAGDLWESPFNFDRGDSVHTHNYCLYRVDDSCNASLSMRARLGQAFARSGNPIIIDPRATIPGGGYLPYVTPINIAVPTTGASVVMVTDPNPENQGFGGGFGGTGYFIHDAKANRIAGQYQGIISMPGHNLRAVIQFENLPLPTPSLNGPTAISMAPGATSVVVSADAPTPFRLSVEDPVNANIDDTTRWIITSSNPNDTMPGEIQQSDGSAAFAVTFFGPGSRTVTATSKGDNTITATMGVVVQQTALTSQVITFTSTPPVLPAVGGAYTVTAAGGDSGNPVVFTIDAASTAGACTVTGSVVTFAGAGTCTINANQAGNATYAAAAQAQQTFVIPVTYTGTTVPTGGAGGAASASFTGGGATCRFDHSATGFMAASALPPGRVAPQGAFRFKLVDCTPGATVRITTTWPQPVAGFTKYGKASSGASSASFFAPKNLAINGHTVSFDLTDGQLGDDDWAPNGVMVDPVIPLAAAALATAIPTLNEWVLLLATAALAAMALPGLRRRQG